MELIKTCEVASSAKALNYKALDLAGELGKLGFDKMAKKLGREFIVAEKMECIAKEKYPIVTDAKVQAFLDSLAKAYNAKRKKNTITLNGHQFQYVVTPQTPTGLLGTTITYSNTLNDEYDTVNEWYRTEPVKHLVLTATTCDAMSNEPGTIGAYKWNEVRIADYEAIPPAPALKALAAAQEKEIFDYFTIASVSAVKDPLLLGRIEGRPERWYLAAWGDDVSLDDVI